MHFRTPKSRQVLRSQNISLALTAEGSNSPGELQTFVERIRDLAQMRGIIEAAETLKKSGPDGIFPDSALDGAWQKLDEIRNESRQSTGNRGPLAKFARTARRRHLLCGLHRPARFRPGHRWRLAIRSALHSRGASRHGQDRYRLVDDATRCPEGNGISVFSLEIDTSEITARIAADEISTSFEPVPYRDIVSQDLTDAQRSKVQEALPSHRAASDPGRCVGRPHNVRN